jgi:Xaa-Pro aminopeptidase
LPPDRQRRPLGCGISAQRRVTIACIVPGCTKITPCGKSRHARSDWPKVGLFKQAAKEIKAILKKEGVADMPIGLDICEPPMLFALQEEGIEVRDGQQMMLLARELKNYDEITLLNIASSMVDGVYQDIAAALKPGVKESQIVALATHRLYEMGSDCVEAITRFQVNVAARIRTTSPID